MKTRIELLMEMGVSGEHAEQYADDLNELLPKYDFSDSKLRVAHFFAQVLHESGMFRFDMENLNYSAKALHAVFRKYFPTMDDANVFGCRTVFLNKPKSCRSTSPFFTRHPILIKIV